VESDNDNSGPVAEEREVDPLERDLDNSMEAFTDVDHIAAQEQIVRDAVVEEQVAQARELLQTQPLQEPQAQLIEQRTL
jgi:hypothetical protein